MHTTSIVAGIRVGSELLLGRARRPSRRLGAATQTARALARPLHESSSGARGGRSRKDARAVAVRVGAQLAACARRRSCAARPGCGRTRRRRRRGARVHARGRARAAGARALTRHEGAVALALAPRRPDLALDVLVRACGRVLAAAAKLARARAVLCYEAPVFLAPAGGGPPFASAVAGFRVSAFAVGARSDRGNDPLGALVAARSARPPARAARDECSHSHIRVHDHGGGAGRGAGAPAHVRRVRVAVAARRPYLAVAHLPSALAR